MRRGLSRRGFVACAVMALAPRPLAAFGRRAEPRYVERWSWALGQPVHLRLFAPDEALAYEAAQAAFAELRRVEGLLSRFDPGSELNALHATAGRAAHPASPDLLAVLRAAAAARGASGGGFDVAVEPLMRVWGFREPRLAPPGAVELAEARAALAAAEVRLDGARVWLPAAHTRLDLGGIGVGYALDRAGAVLRARGVTTALLEVSGDLLALGAPPGSAGWPVDIVSPETPADAAAPAPPLATTRLRDAALATSGQAAQAITLGALRVGHILDPARARPVTARRQGTVVAPTALAADIGSTALLVTGCPLPGLARSWIA